ncbi:MAG: DUF971 domain-containing protein [Verrucomicrobiota bacterium]
MLVPDHIELIADEVAIKWKDGTENYYPMPFLRAASRSAEQTGERDLLGKLHGGSGQQDFPGIRVVRWTPVGGYAIQFTFSDGHNTGLYTYAYLKELAEALGQE